MSVSACCGMSCPACLTCNAGDTRGPAAVLCRWAAMADLTWAKMVLACGALFPILPCPRALCDIAKPEALKHIEQGGTVAHSTIKP